MHRRAGFTGIGVRTASSAVALFASALVAQMVALAAPPKTAITATTATSAAAAACGPALVFGGSGQLGSEVVRVLLGRGCRVSVFVRATSDRSRLKGLDVRLLEGDARVEADVRRAFETERFHVVVNALGRSESGVEFYATTGKLIAQGAAASGVQWVILHSSIGVGESRAGYPPERYARMSPVFEAKGVAEQALIDSGVTYTIIRNGLIRDQRPGVSDGARLVEDPHSFGAVTRPGLARLTGECLDNPACRNRVFNAVDDNLAQR